MLQPKRQDNQPFHALCLMPVYSRKVEIFTHQNPNRIFQSISLPMIYLRKYVLHVKSPYAQTRILYTHRLSNFSSNNVLQKGFWIKGLKARENSPM